MYCAAVAAVFGDYPQTIVSLASDPRTGIASTCKFLPSVAEVKEFCDAATVRKERMDRYAALPKPRPINRDKPPTSEPNLFVPDSSNRYQQMVKRAETEPHRARFGSKLCADGVTRNGVFVQLDWWEAPGEKRPLQDAAKRFYERSCAEDGVDPARGYSNELLKTLDQQNQAAE